MPDTIPIQIDSRAAETKRERHRKLIQQLKTERSSFDRLWQDLADHYSPTRQRFQTTDTNRGDRRNFRILDNTAGIALRSLKSAMMAGITSPARPWFALGTPFPELNKSIRVKRWLDEVGEIMRAAMLKSNLYNNLAELYGDAAVYATSVIFIEEDFDDVFRAHLFPIGSYMLGNDGRGGVGIFAREFRLTVRQIVEKFGMPEDRSSTEIDWSNITEHVQTLWKNHEREKWIDVMHIVEPNPDYDPDKIESRFKRFRSSYFEGGIAGSPHEHTTVGATEHNKYLRERGYDQFPVIAFRWEKNSDDVYGTTCPGIEGLGDTRQLMHMERRGSQGLDKMVNPPLTGSMDLLNRRVTVLPGQVTFVGSQPGNAGLRPTYQVQFPLGELEAKEEQLRQRIRTIFYSHVIQMFTTTDRRQITATEVIAREQEKIQEFGRVLERLNEDALDPLIDLVFGFLVAQGQIPQAPPELQGIELRVEYISVMAQAAKLTGLASVDRFIAFVQGLAEVNASVLDKINFDGAVDRYADILGAPPEILLDEAEVEEIRAAKIEAERARVEEEAAAIGAKTAKDLAAANTEDKNALTDMAKASEAGQLVEQ